MMPAPNLQTQPANPLRKRNWLRIAAILFILTFFAWLFASWTVAYTLTHRIRPPFPEPSPQVDWTNFESCRLQTDDSEQLGGWFSVGEPTRPIVLLFHGNGGSRGSCLKQAELLAREGCGLLMISLRAHGDSTGNRVDFGPLIAHDVISTVQWVEQKQPARNLIIWGQSLGASAAVHASAKLGNRVRGYILECPFSHLLLAVRRRTDCYLPVPLNVLAFAGLNLVAPFVTQEVSVSGQTHGIPANVPVCFLVGEKDQRAPLSDSLEIASGIKGITRIILFEQGDHLELLASDPGKYREQTLNFINACVTPKPEQH